MRKTSSHVNEDVAEEKEEEAMLKLMEVVVEGKW